MDIHPFIVELADMGVPILPVGTTTKDGVWPSGYPSFDAKDNAARILAMRPTDTFAAVMGTRLETPTPYLFGVDCDPRSGGDPVQVHQTLKDMRAPVMAEVITGRGDGGRHYYVATHQPLKSSVGKVAPGVDIIGTGKALYLPGGHTRMGHATPYRIVWHSLWAMQTYEFDSAAFEAWAMPQERARAARTAPEPPKVSPSAIGGIGPVRSPMAYLRATLTGEVNRILSAPPHTRNEATNEAAVRVGSVVAFLGVISTAEQERAYAELVAAARRMQQPEKVVKAGFLQGLSSPRG